MKKFATIALFIFCAFICKAQDTITLKNGEDISAKVTKIGENEVEYLSASNLDGPIYTIDKSDILIIRYANGEKDIFSNENVGTSTKMYTGRGQYRYIKKVYDFRLYQHSPTDKYSRAWAGISTAIIPGLGQALDGEWGRAAGFFLGNFTLNTLAKATMTSYYDNYGNYYYEANGATIALYAANIALNVWAIIDAVRVAKVKNMYLQDKLNGRAAMDIDVHPYLSYEPHIGETFAGVSFGLSF